MKPREARFSSITEGPDQTAARAPAGSRGTILVPCVFMLCLTSLLAIAVLRTGGIGSSTSASLASRSQAHMAALSGVEIAYRRLVENRSYPGEVCWPLADPSCVVDITVADLGDDRFEVVAEATTARAECLIRTEALCTQWTYSYPMAVGGGMRLRGESNVWGDLYVEGALTGSESATITGDVYLPGGRDVEYDAFGNPISIDGASIPTIEGSVYTYVHDIEFPAIDMAELRNLAAAAGQIYTGNVKLQNEELEGVVYIENCSGNPFIKNVVLHGTLVIDDSTAIHVKIGFLKIRFDPAVCAGIAILAPLSCLHVDPNAEVDIYGLTYVNSMQFHGSGIFTGPMIIFDNFDTYPQSDFNLQCPASMAAEFYDNLVWTENRVEEQLFEEL